MNLDEFDKVAGLAPYRRKGMFYSEVFLFLQACQRQRVDLIIESGVKFGMSTRLLSGAGPGEIISIDRDGILLDAALYPNVRMIQSDSRVAVPQLLKQAGWEPPRRVGVLIDGPKGQAALDLKEVCLRWPACRLVGVHDVAAGKGESSHSQEPRFVHIRERLDRFVPDVWRRKYPVGPGLGLWEKKL